jgi:crotonobetainyl-CoA:carnitine CoA-transferase CaiB-like acyl-CoA transferase
VLDLTRVIAGPVCTRTLAAWGADVLRIDPPGFAEVPALLPDTTTGKHCTAMNLRDDVDRARFAALLAEADVIVHGLRPGALAGLGYPDRVLRRDNPRLCIAALNAYGWDGPWAGRRGFDSLLQFSCGIAAASATASAASTAAATDAQPSAGPTRPGALPAQALDHATGYLMAAALCRGLTGRARGRGPADVRASLVGTANLLVREFPPPAGEQRALGIDLSALAGERETHWGPVSSIPQPGTIGGRAGSWRVPAGPLGRHPAVFADTFLP